MSHLYSHIQNAKDRPPVTHLDRGDSGSHVSKDNSSISEITLEQGLKPPPGGGEDSLLLKNWQTTSEEGDVAPEVLMFKAPVDPPPPPQQQQPEQVYSAAPAMALPLSSGLKDPPPPPPPPPTASSSSAAFSLASEEEQQQHQHRQQEQQPDPHYDAESMVSEDDSAAIFKPARQASIASMQYSEVSSTNDSMPERLRSLNQVSVDPIREDEEAPSRATSVTSLHPESPAPRNTDHKYKWYIGIAVIIAILAIIVAVVVVIVTRGNSSQSAESSGGVRDDTIATPGSPATPTTSPTPLSSVLPTGDPLEGFLIQSSFDGGVALRTADTPQNQAFLWLSQDPEVMAGSYDSLQRYALATLYYASGGGNGAWLVDNFWLSKFEHVCEWNNTVPAETRCSGNGEDLLGLSVSNNQLFGSLPPELALADKLVYIEFSLNELEGSIPVEYFTEMGSLFYINLFFNKLAGSLPTEIGLSTLLNYVDLDSNKLSGTLPTELGLLTKLEVFWLNNNQFTGTIPTELGNLNSLQALYLDGNQLTGTVPAALCDLRTLTILMVGCDMVCACCSDECAASGADAEALLEELAAIAFDGGVALVTVDSPQMLAFNWLGNRANLTSISPENRVLLYSLVTFYYATGGAEWINASGWLENDDPCTWFQSDGSGCNADSGVFDYLHLRGDNLVGTLPVELAHISTLTSINLKENGLLRTLPVEYFTNLELLKIDLYRNFLTGTLPTEIGLQTSLEYLDIEENSFQTTLPTELGLLSSVEVLWLSQNLFTGSIPSELSQLSVITELYLSENALVGAVPLGVCELTTLAKLEADCTLSCACCTNGCDIGITRPPIAAPTPSPVPTLSGPADSSLLQLLTLASFDEGVSLSTADTPQNQALNWLQSNANVSAIPDDRLIQRYALATIYYSTAGSGWTLQGGWLSDDDECLWYTTENGNAICDDGPGTRTSMWITTT